MPTAFVHLQCHTEYSLIDGIVRIKPLMAAAAERGFRAVAMTDQANLFGAVKFYKAAMSAGIKPIIGCDLWLQNPDDPAAPHRLTLLCQNQTGYHHLTKLVSMGYRQGQAHGFAQVQAASLIEHAEGLICLAGSGSDVGAAFIRDKVADGVKAAQRWQSVFGDRFYLVVERCGKAHEADYNQHVFKTAQDHDIPVVAGNDVRFLDADDFDAHEARVCIHDSNVLADAKRGKRYTREQYFKSADEMTALFADCPAALANTVEIAKRCNCHIETGKHYLPNFPIPKGSTEGDYLAQISREGLEQRLAFLADIRQTSVDTMRADYDARLQIELDVIQQMGFPGYFLIVADFIQWAKKNGVPVGPGRGSGAGSLVAYALQITDLDPLEYGLLFERFLNPERVSMPDFDIDFCMDGRDRVIDYVADKYGRDSVSQIITYGSMAAKAVVRDVGRVLGHPYGFVDKIAKLIPFELGITLDKALAQEADLRIRYETEEEVTTLIDLARKLEGITRNAGKHAGGVVIAPSLITDFCPLYCEADGQNLVTQFDKDDVEAIGLVKFDFLGLRTLTIIDWAVQTANKHVDTPIDISRIAMDDKASFDLLQACQTTAVFQLESRGMKDLVKRLQPDTFEDIIALVALFRPGPLQSGMVDDFIERKHGRAEVEYLHPKLENILGETYGVILYQEQVMQIAQELAGYTLGGADLLRRAMGKKKPEEMAKQREIFMTGCREQAIDETVATTIFDLMEKFAGYGFNKSHSAAYALVAYQTAWLKAHHPAAFMAAVLSSDMDNTDKVVLFLEECRQMDITVLPPSVQTSEAAFTMRDEDTVLYGLGAIKGVGLSAVENIIETRQQQPFSNLFEFCQHCDIRKVNRRALEALIKAGAMDELGPDRATMMASLEDALKAAQQAADNQARGQDDLFGMMQKDASSAVAVQWTTGRKWSQQQQLRAEKETLGFYLSGHPVTSFRQELNQIVSAPLGELVLGQHTHVIIAGLAVQVKRIITKTNKRMAVVTLEDETGRLECVIFSDLFDEKKDLLETPQLIVVEGELSHDDFSGGMRLVAERMWDFVAARQQFLNSIRLCLNCDESFPEQLSRLQSVLKQYNHGTLPVAIKYQREDAMAELALGEAWSILPTDACLAALQALLGVEGVELVYQPK
jgi:DNA polymerase III subunit alpha